MSVEAHRPSRWGARYLLRFDDLCPTMNWAYWNVAEEMLDEFGVKPIIAVIPDNRDPKLTIDPPAPDFWEKVRRWQARGWAIGLHGHQHLYVNSEPGMLGRSNKSEFAGLPYDEQHEKLRQGLEIFAREGVRADAWVAPSHSFDQTTVSALRALGVQVISDGSALTPYRDAEGMVWVPQQFGWMRPMPFGIWTFCYHMENFSTMELRAAFRKGLERLGPRIISLQEAVAMGDRPYSMVDRLAGSFRRAISGVR